MFQPSEIDRRTDIRSIIDDPSNDGYPSIEPLQNNEPEIRKKWRAARD